MYFTFIYFIVLISSKWVEATADDKPDSVTPNTDHEKNIEDTTKNVNQMHPNPEHEVKEMTSGVHETYESIHGTKETPQDTIKNVNQMHPNPEHEVKEMTSGVHETYESIHSTKQTQEDEKSGTREEEMHTTEFLPASTKEPSKDYTYKVFDSNEEPCLLAKFEAVFTITYSIKDGEQNVAENPVHPDIKGRCGDTDSPFLQLIWSQFEFNISFSKLPNKDDTNEWAVTSLNLQYDTADPLFYGAINDFCYSLFLMELFLT